MQKHIKEAREFDVLTDGIWNQLWAIHITGCVWVWMKIDARGGRFGEFLKCELAYE